MLRASDERTDSEDESKAEAVVSKRVYTWQNWLRAETHTYSLVPVLTILSFHLDVLFGLQICPNIKILRFDFVCVTSKMDKAMGSWKGKLRLQKVFLW